MKRGRDGGEEEDGRDLAPELSAFLADPASNIICASWPLPPPRPSMSASGSLPFPSPGAEWPSPGAWPSPEPEAAIVVPGVRCDDTCRFSNDNSCDDGGVGSAYSQCPLGTDCSDCTGEIIIPHIGTTWVWEPEPSPEPSPSRRSSSLKDAPEFTAALAAWRHSFSETPTVGVSDAGGAPTDDVFRV